MPTLPFKKKIKRQGGPVGLPVQETPRGGPLWDKRQDGKGGPDIHQPVPLTPNPFRTRRQEQRDLNEPVPLPVDFASVSPHERDVARYRSEDARAGAQTDATPPMVRYKRGLRHVRLKSGK